METITLKFNRHSTAGKAIDAMIKALANLPGVEVIDHYDSAFIEKIREAEKRADFKEVNPKDLWGSLGLK